MYPSQTTYNLIAELENGSKDYNNDEDVDPEVRKYLVKVGNGYSLLTNTKAQIRWKDTREENPRERTEPYNDLDPVPTTAQEMDIEKIWKGSYRSDEGLEEQLPMTMHILRNGEKYEDINLDFEHQYKGSKYIATGLMRVNEAAGTVQVLDSGYDYSLKEDETLSYHWELIADVLHPMLINGQLVNLKVVEKEDIPAGMPDDAQYWTDGTTKYYRFENNGTKEVFTASESSSALSATNVRRSNLNLTKVVNGDKAPDEFFTFSMTLGNPENAEEDFYFSVWNNGYVVPEEIPADQWGGDSAQVVEDGFTVTGATAEIRASDNKKTGYYVVAPGDPFTVTLKEGWNLRFTNVLTGTTYEITEVTPLATGFQFVSSDLKVTEIKANSSDEEKDITAGSADPKIEDETISGKIDQGNANFTVTYTNEYLPAVITPKVTKKVTGADAAEPFSFKISLKEGDATQITYKGSDKVSTTAEMKENDPQTLTFDEIELNAEGTYVFTVEETNEDAPAGWTYANTEADKKDITVTVKDDGSGKLVPTLTGDNPTFENKYVPEPVPVEIKINKNIESLNPELNGTETFTFKLEDTDDKVNVDQEKSITVAETGTTVADFDAIVFDTPGTYEFKVTEIIDNLDGGYVVSGSPETFTITVDDNAKDGILHANPAEVTVDITNEYPTVNIPVTKTWDDSNFYVDGEPIEGYERPKITINVYADGGEEPVATHELSVENVDNANKNQWKYTFEKLPKFSEHGEHEIVYTIDEVVPDGFVKKNGEATYEVINTPIESEEIVEPLELMVKKTDSITGNVIGTGSTFVLTGGDLAEPVEYKTGDTGTFRIRFEKEGTYVLTETVAPVGYERETLPSYTITVDKEFIEVKVNEDKTFWQWFYELVFGTPSPEFEKGTLTVPNPPTETEVAGTKVWEDATDQDRVRPASVTFQLYKTVNGVDTKIDGKTVTLNKPEGEIVNTWTEGGTITGLPAYEDGYPVTYWFVELKADGTEVTNNGMLDDNYRARYSDDRLTVTNSYTPDVTSVTVLKVWDDEEFLAQADKGYARPGSVTVKLLADGKEVTQEGITAEQTLNEDNGWTYTWTGLNKKKDE